MLSKGSKSTGLIRGQGPDGPLDGILVGPPEVQVFEAEPEVIKMVVLQIQND